MDNRAVARELVALASKLAVIEPPVFGDIFELTHGDFGDIEDKEALAMVAFTEKMISLVSKFEADVKKALDAAKGQGGDFARYAYARENVGEVVSKLLKGGSITALMEKAEPFQRPTK